VIEERTQSKTNDTVLETENYRKLIVRSTCDSVLRRAKISLGNIVSRFTNTIRELDRDRILEAEMAFVLRPNFSVFTPLHFVYPAVQNTNAMYDGLGLMSFGLGLEF